MNTLSAIMPILCRYNPGYFVEHDENAAFLITQKLLLRYEHHHKKCHMSVLDPDLDPASLLLSLSLSLSLSYDS
jgi:hypothetical protein